MARKITFKDGPLKGKTYLIPEDMKRLTHTGGHYRITAKANTWEPEKSTAPKPSPTNAQRAD